MTSIYEARKPFRTAIGTVDGIQTHTVVTPTAFTRKLGDGHHADVCDAECREVLESPERAVERPFGGERSNVELVQDPRAEWWRGERLTPPIETRNVDDSARPMGTFWLLSRAWIGSGRPAIERKFVECSRLQIWVVDSMKAVLGVLHDQARLVHDDFHSCRERCPNFESTHPNSRSSNATGNLSRRSDMRWAPACHVAPERTSRQVPVGSSSTVSFQPRSWIPRQSR